MTHQLPAVVLYSHLSHVSAQEHLRSLWSLSIILNSFWLFGDSHDFRCNSAPGAGHKPCPLRRGAVGPLRITLFGCSAPDLPRPAGPDAGPLSPSAAAPSSRIGAYRTETFFVGSACFARISAYHVVAHFERRLLSRLREELRRVPLLLRIPMPVGFRVVGAARGAQVCLSLLCISCLSKYLTCAYLSEATMTLGIAPLLLLKRQLPRFDPAQHCFASTWTQYHHAWKRTGIDRTHA